MITCMMPRRVCSAQALRLLDSGHPVLAHVRILQRWKPQGRIAYGTESVQMIVGLPSLVNVDPRGVELVRCLYEVQAARRNAGRTSYIRDHGQVPIAIGGRNMKRSGNDDQVVSFGLGDLALLGLSTAFNAWKLRGILGLSKVKVRRVERHSVGEG
jgi:hypothetical protein